VEDGVHDLLRHWLEGPRTVEDGVHDLLPVQEVADELDRLDFVGEHQAARARALVRRLGEVVDAREVADELLGLLVVRADVHPLHDGDGRVQLRAILSLGCACGSERAASQRHGETEAWSCSVRPTAGEVHP
jgi:hypothetical protein